MLDRGYTGHEYLFGVGLVHINGRLYDPLLHRFTMLDNFVQDLTNTQNFNRFAYVLSNPLKYTDSSGEFIVAALIRASIRVITNGISNTLNGEGFFKGAGKSAVFGAIGDAASFGIGQVASNIASSLASSGASAATSSFVTGAFQAGAHALLGGSLSALQGGKFGAGALSGAFSSISSSLVGGLNTGSKFLNAAEKIGTAGLSGGVGSVIGGDKFIDGVRQGLISGALNHGVHAGWFGKNMAVAAMTQRLRHLFGPDTNYQYGYTNNGNPFR